MANPQPNLLPFASGDAAAGLGPDRFDLLVDALPAGVVVLDGAGRVQRSNPVAGELLGAPLDGELWRDVAQRTFLPAQGEALELRCGRAVNLDTCPLGSGPGQILLLHDVTENRRLRERLSHAQRLTDMGRMAASLAHQIRTPLATALLYASHLCSEGLPEAKRTRFAGKLTERLHHLERLIDDMLAFARGDVNPNETIPIDEFLEAVESTHSEPCRAQRIDLVVNEAPAVAVRGNRTLLQTLFQNLIANAREALGQGGRIELAARRDGPSVVIMVSDNGPGVPAGWTERVFEPFATTRADGNGLGLAVVRAVARAHRGEVTVASRRGEGCTFTVTLPCADPHSPKAPVTEQR